MPGTTFFADSSVLAFGFSEVEVDHAEPTTLRGQTYIWIRLEVSTVHAPSVALPKQQKTSGRQFPLSCVHPVTQRVEIGCATGMYQEFQTRLSSRSFNSRVTEAPGLQVQGAQSRHSAIKSRISHLGTLAFGYVESRSLLLMYRAASCGQHSYTYPRWSGLTPRGKITTT